jgi:dihydrofolate reductase
MRRIVAFNNVTVDGYFTAADGNLGWVVQDEQLGKSAAAGMADSDTILFGRRTYEMFEAFWPTALSYPDAMNPHAASPLSAEQRAMGHWINDANKIVFSTTRNNVSWRNSRLFHELDPRKIEALKNEPGKAMMIFGSGSIVSQLTQHGLIDEYMFFVNPILLGEGRPLVSGLSASRGLELMEARTYPSGCVMLRYVRPSP